MRFEPRSSPTCSRRSVPRLPARVMLVASRILTRTPWGRGGCASTSNSLVNAAIQSPALANRFTSATSLTSANPASAAAAAVSISERSATAHIRISRRSTSGLSILRARLKAPVSSANALTLPPPPKNAIKYGHWNSTNSPTSTRSVMHLAYASP